MVFVLGLVLAMVSSAAAQTGIGYETGTLSGVVTTNGGIVPPMATVRARSVANTSETSAYINSLGQYSLELPAGDYQVAAFYGMAQVGSFTLTVAAGDTPTHDFLFAAGYLSAKVTRNGADDLGAPLFIENNDPVPGCGAPNATCQGDATNCFCMADTGRAYTCYPSPNPSDPSCRWMNPLSFQTSSNASGIARALVPAGIYKFSVGSSNPSSMMPMGGQYGSVILGSELAVPVGDAADVLGGQYSYQTAVVTGHVTGGGQPMTNVTIVANAGPSGGINAWVDATGTYTMQLPTLATYTISALQDGGALIDSEANVNLLPGTTTVLDFAVAGATVSGTVLADGVPAPNASVYIVQQPPSSCAAAESCIFDYSADGGPCNCQIGGQQFMCNMPGSTSQCQWMMGGTSSAYTDSNGVFSKLMGPGTYAVRIMSAPLPSDPMQMMTMQWGAVAVGGVSNVVVGTQPIALGTFAYSTGTVSGDALSCGRPLSQVTFTLQHSTGSISVGNMGPMGSDSSYSIRAPVGDYTLDARLQNVVIASTPMSISSTPSTWQMNYDIGSLRGLIMRNGEPSTNSPVFITEVAQGLSCQAPPNCAMHDPNFQVCFGCTAPTGRRYWCDANGCHFEMAASYSTTTGTDGLFTVELPPARWQVVAMSGASNPGDPMGGGGQSGGIVVGSFQVDVAACTMTEVNVQPVAVQTGEQTVELGQGLVLSFDNVETAGTAAFVSSVSPPPNEPEPPFQSAGVFYDIFVPEFSGRVLVCLPYDPETLGPNPDLRIYHNDATLGWVDITELPIDTINHVVCGYTESFSWFAVGTPSVSEPDLVINGPIADLSANATCTASAQLSATGGSSYVWLRGTEEIGTGASITANLTLGENIITVRSGTRSGSITIHVNDVTPPTVTSFAVAPAVLWPPTGQLVTVAPTGTFTDNCDATPTVISLAASSAAAVPADIALTPTSVALRAFRRGNETAGRRYAIEYAIVDDAGNQTRATATVTVPHDKR
jgi:hypothetical protein